MKDLIRCTCDNGCDQCNRGWQLHRITVHRWETVTEWVPVDEFTERPQIARRPAEYTETWEPAPDDMIPAEVDYILKPCPVCGIVADLYVPFDCDYMQEMCLDCLLAMRTKSGSAAPIIQEG